jgi:hypothetical protein
MLYEQILFTFLTCWFGLLVTTKIIRGHSIPAWHFIVLSMGITGVIYTN